MLEIISDKTVKELGDRELSRLSTKELAQLIEYYRQLAIKSDWYEHSTCWCSMANLYQNEQQLRQLKEIQ